MPSNCIFAHCAYSDNAVRKNNIPKRSLFILRRPELARTKEEMCHRQKLCDIVLQLHEKNDRTVRDIRDMLHRESAAICEVHFREEDFIVRAKRKRLRIGAIPVLHMPENYFKEVLHEPLPLSEPTKIQTFIDTEENNNTKNICLKMRKLEKDQKEPFIVLEKLAELTNNKKSVNEESTNNGPADEILKYSEQKNDKRSTFEQLMYKLILMLHDFCKRSYVSLESVFQIDQDISSEYAALLEKVAMIKKLNSVSVENGGGRVEAEKIIGSENMKEWLETTEFNKNEVVILQQEVDTSEKDASVATNIPLEQIVFHTTETNNDEEIELNNDQDLHSVVEILQETPGQEETENVIHVTNTTGVNENQIVILPAKLPDSDEKSAITFTVPIAMMNNSESLKMKKAKKRKRVSNTKVGMKNDVDRVEFEKYKTVDVKLGEIYKCQSCDSRYRHWYELRQHFKIHTGELNTKCKLCGKIIRKTSEKFHMFSHSKDSKYTCKRCGAKFNFSHHLKKHMKSKTSCKYLAFQCQLCGEKFKEMDEIKEHFTIRHCFTETHCNKCNLNFNPECISSNHQLKPLRPYKCEVCDISFSFRINLVKHNNMEHRTIVDKGPLSFTQNKAKFICEICSKTFPSQEKFNYHKQTHFTKSCKTCGIQLRNQSALYKHRRLHTKPFKCEECLQSFSQSEQLRNHSCVSCHLENNH